VEEDNAVLEIYCDALAGGVTLILEYSTDISDELILLDE
jgi:hypothetical protein